MTIINTSISSTASGTYGISNDLIGQLKTILLNDSNITIISDNGDSDPEVARELIYTIAENPRNYRMLSYTTRRIIFGIMNLTNTNWQSIPNKSYTSSRTTLSFTSGLSYSVYFLYGTKSHVLAIPNNRSYWFIALNTNDSDGWYLFNTGLYNTYSNKTNIFKSNSDDHIYGYDARWYCEFLRDDGKFIGMTTRFLHFESENDYYILDYYYPGIYYQYNTISEGVHHDTNGDSYLVLSYDFIIKDI